MPLTVDAWKIISEVGGEGGSLLEAFGCNGGCVSIGKVVSKEVSSGGVRCISHIGLFQRLVGDAVIWFWMPFLTKGAAYSVAGSEGGER